MSGIGAVVAYISDQNAMDRRREATIAAVQGDATRDFILTIIKNVPGKDFNLDIDEGQAARVGQQAINDYRTPISTGGGAPPPPKPGNPSWELEGCKLKIKKSAYFMGGEIKPPPVDVCTAAATCIGIAYLRCPADQDMSCINRALTMKCVYF